MKKENKKETKNQREEENHWVDVHNDEVMIALGLRPRSITPRDPSVWTKTPHEHKILRSLRNAYKDDMHFKYTPTKHIPVRAKLIIQLKKNKKYPKTTYSTECWQNEIPFVLSKYRIKVNGQDVTAVAKYTYNGKTYTPNEVPFW